MTADPAAARRRRRRATRRVRATPAELEETLGAPMFDAALRPTATARASDPVTSHEAAVRLGDLLPRQRAVLECLRAHGPMADHELLVRYAEGVHDGRWIAQSGSGIRSRRCELTDLVPPLVVPTGEKVPTPSGGKAQVWAAAP